MENVVQIPSLSDSGRRRAIATTLKQWFDKDTILEALCVVEDMGDSAGLGVIKLTNSLAEHFKWDIQVKHDVRMSLYRNMLPSAKLDPDPVEELESYRARRGAAKVVVKEPAQVVSQPEPEPQPESTVAANHADVSGSAAVFIVFSRIIEGMRQQVKAAHPQQFSDFHAAVRTEIQELTVSPYVVQWVESVFNNVEGTLTNSGLTEMHMSAVVHAFYNGVADAVGPVDADKVLTAAIAHAEQSPAAAQFSPKNFL